MKKRYENSSTNLVANSSPNNIVNTYIESPINQMLMNFDRLCILIKSL